MDVYDGFVSECQNKGNIISTENCEDGQKKPQTEIGDVGYASSNKGQREIKDLWEKDRITLTKLLDLHALLSEFSSSIQSELARIASHEYTPNFAECYKLLKSCLMDLIKIMDDIISNCPNILSPGTVAAVRYVKTYILSIQPKDVNLQHAHKLVVHNIGKLINACIKRYSSQRWNELHERIASHRIVKNITPIFGTDLKKHLSDIDDKVPFVIQLCIREVESRGKNLEGIYRLSSVQSRINELVEMFEKYRFETVLDDIPVKNVANVFKLYLRQLPEPLFTFQLYDDIIKVGVMYQTEMEADNPDFEKCVNTLREIMLRLPKEHVPTAKAVMKHLKFISDRSRVNSMSPHNLALVFAPTLLQPKNRNRLDAEEAFADNASGANAVELMIRASEFIFKDFRGEE